MVVFCLEIFREMRTSLISVSELVFFLDKQREKKGCLRCKLNRCHFACKTKFTENDVKWRFFFCFAKKIFRENEVEFYVSKWDIFNFIFWPRAFLFIQLCHKKYSVFSTWKVFMYLYITIWYFLSFFLCDFKSMFIVVFDDLINICNM